MNFYYAGLIELPLSNLFLYTVYFCHKLLVTDKLLLMSSLAYEGSSVGDRA